MTIRHFIASQLRKPTGLFGSVLLSRLMNFGNREIITSTIKHLQLNDHHHVLEVGFGGGSGLRQTMNFLKSGKVTGIDYSIEMVKLVKRNFWKQIEMGKIDVRFGDVLNLQFADETFDRVFTVNAIYFWPDVLKGFSEIRRVLKHGGLVAVSLRFGVKMKRASLPKEIFQLFSPKDVSELMKEAGFSDIRINHFNQNKLTGYVVVLGMRL
ncbi:MAG: class I SAM-dependent methyltransferase [Desulfatiglans sp.]|jgi:ubiquinone/menaquinone biosynthesis C-methylase UbiE|nr:class I SAM-dependent methyltransferase [Desulfatiglans sp.]